MSNRIDHKLYSKENKKVEFSAETLMQIRKIYEFIDHLPKVLRQFEKLLLRNRIFMDRTIHVGPISAESAMNYGFSGPNLRLASESISSAGS